MSWRSVGAVVAGFALVVVLSTAVDAVLHASGVFPPPGQPMATGLWVLATAYRCAFQLAGGFVTARLAPRRPTLHVVVLGAIGLAAAIAGVVVTWNAGPALGPRWYPIGLAVLAFPTVWAGGLAHARWAAPGGR